MANIVTYGSSSLFYVSFLCLFSRVKLGKFAAKGPFCFFREGALR